MHRSRRGYYTRVGWPVWSVLIGTAAVLGTLYYQGAVWKTVVALGMLEMFAFGLIVQTEYVIEADRWLNITGAFHGKQKIDIVQIQHIEAVTDYSFAPAFSPHRLAIYHSHGAVVLVSPESQDDFLAKLKAINPEIAVKTVVN